MGKRWISRKRRIDGGHNEIGSNIKLEKIKYFFMESLIIIIEWERSYIYRCKYMIIRTTNQQFKNTDLKYKFKVYIIYYVGTVNLMLIASNLYEQKCTWEGVLHAAYMWMWKGEKIYPNIKKKRKDKVEKFYYSSLVTC